MGELRDMNENARNGEDSALNGLTGIPQRIHCPATRNESEAGNNELDTNAIENFLDTLGQIALGIATRAEEDNPDRDS